MMPRSGDSTAEDAAGRWVRCRFKGCKVWVRADPQGRLLVTGGRVEIRYRPDDTRTYQAALRRIESLDQMSPGAPPRPQAPHADDPPGTIVVYTDGACIGNPGPTGWAAYLRYGVHARDLSGYLGDATNNVGELCAIKEALTAIRKRRIPVHLYSDSRYARGVLTRGWKAVANAELVTEIRALLAGFSSVRFMWVKGHDGIPENEWVDYLAGKAIRDARPAGCHPEAREPDR